MHAHDGRAGAITGGDFFQGQGQAEVTGLRAAPLFGHQHAEETQLAHFLQGFSRKAVFAVPIGREGFQALLGELARHVANLQVLL
ncbi:hypothetical protein D3C78_1179440 [compost metagenome]